MASAFGPRWPRRAAPGGGGGGGGGLLFVLLCASAGLPLSGQQVLRIGECRPRAPPPGAGLPAPRLRAVRGCGVGSGAPPPAERLRAGFRSPPPLRKVCPGARCGGSGDGSLCPTPRGPRVAAGRAWKVARSPGSGLHRSLQPSAVCSRPPFRRGKRFPSFVLSPRPRNGGSAPEVLSVRVSPGKQGFVF